MLVQSLPSGRHEGSRLSDVGTRKDCSSHLEESHCHTTARGRQRTAVTTLPSTAPDHRKRASRSP